MKPYLYLTIVLLYLQSDATLAHSSEKDTLAAIQAGDVLQLKHDLEVNAQDRWTRLTIPIYSEKFGISNIEAVLSCSLSFPSGVTVRKLPAQTRLKLSQVYYKSFYTGPLEVKDMPMTSYGLDRSSLPPELPEIFRLIRFRIWPNSLQTGHLGSYTNLALRASIEPVADFEHLDIDCRSSAKFRGSERYSSLKGVRFVLDFIHGRAIERKFSERDLAQFFTLRK